MCIKKRALPTNILQTRLFSSVLPALYSFICYTVSFTFQHKLVCIIGVMENTHYGLVLTLCARLDILTLSTLHLTVEYVVDN